MPAPVNPSWRSSSSMPFVRPLKKRAVTISITSVLMRHRLNRGQSRVACSQVS